MRSSEQRKLEEALISSRLALKMASRELYAVGYKRLGEDVDHIIERIKLIERVREQSIPK